MTVVKDIPFKLDKRDVLRGLSMGTSPSARPEIDRLIDKMLGDEPTLRLIKPALAYSVYSIIKMNGEDCHLENDVTLHGATISRLFRNARALAVAVATIGPELEASVTGYFKRGSCLKGLVLHAMGNGVTENLRFAAHGIISKEAERQDLKASSPVSPGGASFPISEQFNLFKLVAADAIGVRLTETAMMVPLKSLSMVIGLGENMPVWSASERCDMCLPGKVCLYRYQPEPGCEKADLYRPVSL